MSKMKDWQAERIRIRRLTEAALIEIIESEEVSPGDKLEAIKILRELLQAV